MLAHWARRWLLKNDYGKIKMTPEQKIAILREALREIKALASASPAAVLIADHALKASTK